MNLDLYITQDIPNKETALGEAERKIVITSIQIFWKSLVNPLLAHPEIVVFYEILFTKDGVNLNDILKGKIKPKPFNNSMLVYQRSFEPETLFQPLENPDFIEGESSESERFLTMGAFDFIVGELVTKHPDYLIPFLKMYILDNYEDGWFENAN